VPGEDLLCEGYPAASESQGCLLGHLGNLVRAAPSPWLIPLPAAGCRECQQQTQSSWLWASHLEGAPRMMWTLVRKYMWTLYKQKHVNCIAANDANQVLHLHACICWNKISKMQTTPTYPNTTSHLPHYNYSDVYFNCKRLCRLCFPLVAYFNGPSLGPDQTVVAAHPQIAWDWFMPMRVISLGRIMWTGERLT
jgi:hypothetical protein